MKEEEAGYAGPLLCLWGEQDPWIVPIYANLLQVREKELEVRCQAENQRRRGVGGKITWLGEGESQIEGYLDTELVDLRERQELDVRSYLEHARAES